MKRNFSVNFLEYFKFLENLPQTKRYLSLSSIINPPKMIKKKEKENLISKIYKI